MKTQLSKVNTENELVTVDSIRQHIMNGDVYMVFDSSLNGKGLAKDASYNCLFYSGGSCTHKVKVFIEHDQSINFRVYEMDASLNVRGYRRILPYNYNRNKSDSCKAQFTKSIPAGGISQAQSTLGKLIKSKYAWASNTTGPQGRTSFGISAEEYSFITHPSKYYVLQIYNRGPGVCMMGMFARVSECTV